MGVTREWMLFGIVAACSLIGWNWGIYQGTVEREIGLTVLSLDLDIGSVYATDDFHWTLPISNITSETIVIDQLASTCDCLVVGNTGLTIPPNGTAKCELRWDLTRQQPRTGGHGDVYRVETEIIPVINGRSRDLSWEIHGIVRPTFLDLPRDVFWLESWNSGPARDARPVDVRTVTEITGIQAQSDNVLIERIERVESSESLAGNVFRLWIKPRDDVGAGPFRGEIKVSGVTEDGVVASPVTLQTAGAILSKLRLSDSQFVFGVALKGDSVQHSFHLDADSSPHARILSVSAQDGSVVCSAVGNHEFVVTIRSDVVGSVNTMINVCVAVESGQPDECICIPVQGVILEPPTMTRRANHATVPASK